MGAPQIHQRFAPGARLPRHRHAAGYLAVVIDGAYTEAGDAGRFRLTAGQLVHHREFEAHGDQFGTAGARVLNLPCPPDAPPLPVGRLADLDGVVRLAERDPAAAATLALASLNPVCDERDWPDLLAADLRADPSLRLDAWAETAGLAPSTLARGFLRAYGVSPKRYRAEVRALKAWRCIASSPLTLAEFALELGFADQAHMTRALVKLTGRTPAAVRRVAGRVDSGPTIHSTPRPTPSR
ncbi:AraC family transcriptional regulator [Nannocystis sp. ILAH1]|uniref:helix-turn-helix domain-containing protein n=1 Tax=Nannocystis sp. ILAH1 TaxID=2996789 RepID=UPI00226EA3FE|nr:AraC family transcriptional regulator [Nannocystis sp. ILAH1]MCY0994611.1 AraC family transcriptional regulator [Nannocystis sp. ILAH1]